MRKYFFDLVGQDHCQYDYRGRLLPAIEKACQLAELIAMDLEMRGEGEWTGWSVNVRSEQGQQLFAIPVRYPELAAA